MADYYQGGDKAILEQLAKDMRDTRDRVIRMEEKVDAATAAKETVSDHGVRIAVLEDRDAQASDTPARWAAVVGIAAGAIALARGFFGDGS